MKFIPEIICHVLTFLNYNNSSLLLYRLVSSDFNTSERIINNNKLKAKYRKEFRDLQIPNTITHLIGLTNNKKLPDSLEYLEISIGYCQFVTQNKKMTEYPQKLKYAHFVNYLPTFDNMIIPLPSTITNLGINCRYFSILPNLLKNCTINELTLYGHMYSSKEHLTDSIYDSVNILTICYPYSRLPKNIKKLIFLKYCNSCKTSTDCKCTPIRYTDCSQIYYNESIEEITFGKDCFKVFDMELPKGLKIVNLSMDAGTGLKNFIQSIHSQYSFRLNYIYF